MGIARYWWDANFPEYDRRIDNRGINNINMIRGDEKGKGESNREGWVNRDDGVIDNNSE